MSHTTLWAPEEDQLILEMYANEGPRWSKMASKLPGRTTSSVRNRWQRIEQGRKMREAGQQSRNRCHLCGQPKKGHVCMAKLGHGSQASIHMQTMRAPVPPIGMEMETVQSFLNTLQETFGVDSTTVNIARRIAGPPALETAQSQLFAAQLHGMVQSQLHEQQQLQGYQHFRTQPHIQGQHLQTHQPPEAASPMGLRRTRSGSTGSATSSLSGMLHSQLLIDQPDQATLPVAPASSTTQVDILRNLSADTISRDRVSACTMPADSSIVSPWLTPQFTAPPSSSSSGSFLAHRVAMNGGMGGTNMESKGNVSIGNSNGINASKAVGAPKPLSVSSPKMKRTRSGDLTTSSPSPLKWSYYDFIDSVGLDPEMAQVLDEWSASNDPFLQETAHQVHQGGDFCRIAKTVFLIKKWRTKSEIRRLMDLIDDGS